MKKFTQQELLNEGLWNTLKSGTRLAGGIGAGAVKGISKGLDVVAPELTKPLHSLERGAREYGRDVKDEFLRVWEGKKKFIKRKLREVGYDLDEKRPVKKVTGGHLLVYAFRIDDYNPKTGEPVYYSPKGVPRHYPLVVDPETGFISKNLSTVRHLTSKKK